MLPGPSAVFSTVHYCHFKTPFSYHGPVAHIEYYYYYSSELGCGVPAQGVYIFSQEEADPSAGHLAWKISRRIFLCLTKDGHLIVISSIIYVNSWAVLKVNRKQFTHRCFTTMLFFSENLKTRILDSSIDDI